MARLLAETADLMEIDGADSFRIRSYRRAAEAAEQTTVDLAAAAPIRRGCWRFPASARAWRRNLRPSPRPARCRCAMSCWPSTAPACWSC